MTVQWSWCVEYLYPSGWMACSRTYLAETDAKATMLMMAVLFNVQVAKMRVTRLA